MADKRTPPVARFRCEELTSGLGLRASLLLARLVAIAVLVIPRAPHLAAQTNLPRFERSDCRVDGPWARDLRRECGWLVVPESRDHRSARPIRLAVEIFRALQPNETPPVVFLHGGPGGVGSIRLFSEGVARGSLSVHRDVVLYDQRGAGFSTPKLCEAYDRIAEVVLNLVEGTERERKLTEARRACIAELEAQGIDRLGYNTAASVADLIDLRRTLGYPSWDIYSASYGARVAQEAMARDGSAIRSVLMASPTARSFSFQAEQPLSTQRALERLFAECARQPLCRGAFPNVEQDFYATYDDLTRSPVPVPIARPDGAHDTVSFHGKRLVDEIRNLLVDRPRVAVGRLPFLLHELRTGDRLRASRELVGTGSAPARLANRALRELVNCADYATYGVAYARTLDSVNAIARTPFRRARDRECDDWLPRSGDGTMPPPVSSAIPTLILTGKFDDRTPTEHARRIAASLSRASLVEFPDEGHDGRGSRCHGQIVLQFLQNPTRQVDASCVATIPPISFTTTWEPAGRP